MKRSGGWNQEVTDAQGRRRFHGAFTGGFSAGHFNSVGSEKGWQPAAFVSSRASRAHVEPRRAEDFMDEEDDPLLGKRLETAEAYDTLQQHERQRIQDAHAARIGSRAAAFHVPDELILPASGDSIGKKLLSQMGWKDGHGIGPCVRRRKLSIGAENEEEKDDEVETKREDGATQEDALVLVPPRNTVDVRVFPQPKLDKYGAGFDPYVDAPEFLRHKLKEQNGQQQPPQRQVVTFAQALGGGGSVKMTGSAGGRATRVAMGFGLSALEENDDLDVYESTSMDDFDRAIATAGEPVKLLDSMTNHARDEKRREGREASSVLCADGRPALEGFRIASKRERPPKSVIERLDVPSDFRAYHVFDEQDEVAAVTSLYGKFNFSTEKNGRGSTITAKQRAQILREDEDISGGQDLASKVTSGSVFDLMDPAQREKLMGTAQAVRGRQPLTQGAPSEQFRANIMASISKRFVSASTSETTEADAGGTSGTNGVVQKKSFRTESAWAPHVLLCKRFRVTCEGQTVSGGANGGEDMAPDLFTTELAPHLVDLAASRREDGKRDNLAQIKSKAARQDDKLPPIPVAPKPSVDLLRSIFEPSDDSGVEEESDQESDQDDDLKQPAESREASGPLAQPTAAAGPVDPGTSAMSSQLVNDSSATDDSSTDECSDDGQRKTKKHKKHKKSDDKKREKSKHKKDKDSKSKKSKKSKSRHSSRESSSRSSRHDRDRDSKRRDRSRSRSRERHRKDSSWH